MLNESEPFLALRILTFGYLYPRVQDRLLADSANSFRLMTAK